MTPDIEKLYESVGQLLISGLNGFTKVWVYVEMLEDTGNVSIYYEKGDGTLVGHSPFSGLETKLFSPFNRMWRLWRELTGQPWSTAEFFLQDSGKFDINFGYDDVSAVEKALARRDEWTKKRFLERQIQYE